MSSTAQPSSKRRRRVARPTSRGKRIGRLLIGFFAVAMLVDAIVGERGLLAMLRARDQYEAASAALERQRAENARLNERVERLKNDPAAIEELARGELGLMRPGEKVFILKDRKPASPR